MIFAVKSRTIKLCKFLLAFIVQIFDNIVKQFTKVLHNNDLKTFLDILHKKSLNILVKVFFDLVRIHAYTKQAYII